MKAALPDPLFDLSGRAILIAGGAGGLGAPIARALAARGARVLIADIDAPRAQEIASQLRADGATADAVALNVVESASCAKAVQAAVDRWERLDGLLNATGTYKVATALELGDEAWEQTIEINLTGAFRLARAAGKVMLEQRAGHIVTLASVSSVVSNPRYAAYASSKAGVAQMTRVLAVEWAPFGVTVNAIGPAATPTALAGPIFADEGQRALALSRIPMRRFGTPDDIIAASIFLLAPGSSFVTGQTLFVDGGRTIA